MENINERNEELEVEDMTQDYLTAIKELKQNSVDKQKYIDLRNENKKLLDAVVNGQLVEKPNVEKKANLDELRKNVFQNDHQTNLEYIDNVLKLRTALIESGQEDPFVPQGSKVNATQADYDRANKVARILQEMVDESEGDPAVFLNEYQRRVKDTSIKKK